MFTRSPADAKRMLSIGFVTPDAKAGQKLRQSIMRQDNIELKMVESRTVGAAHAPKDIGVFLYDLENEDEGTLHEFNRFMRERPADIPVIVLSPQVSEELVRWFLRLRVADWLATPLAPGELVAACGRVLSQQNAAQKHDTRCVTFIGARGGVGTTTLPTTAAVILAGRGSAQAPTCLIDLDLVAGACADYLDVKPNWQFDELLANPERLDGHMLDIMLSTHRTGISVLSSQLSFSDRLRYDADVVTRTLDLAAQKFTNLVVDLPRQATAWTDSVILGSNELYVVTEATIPGLRFAKRLVGEIIDQFDGEVQPKVIVNKNRKSLFGSGLSGHEVREILRNSLAGYVGEDLATAREAIDRGVPVTAIKARSRIAKDLTKILRGK